MKAPLLPPPRPRRDKAAARLVSPGPRRGRGGRALPGPLPDGPRRRPPRVAPAVRRCLVVRAPVRKVLPRTDVRGGRARAERAEGGARGHREGWAGAGGPEERGGARARARRTPASVPCAGGTKDAARGLAPVRLVLPGPRRVGRRQRRLGAAGEGEGRTGLKRRVPANKPRQKGRRCSAETRSFEGQRANTYIWCAARRGRRGRAEGAPAGGVGPRAGEGVPLLRRGAGGRRPEGGPAARAPRLAAGHLVGVVLAGAWGGRARGRASAGGAGARAGQKRTARNLKGGRVSSAEETQRRRGRAATRQARRPPPAARNPPAAGPGRLS